MRNPRYIRRVAALLAAATLGSFTVGCSSNASTVSFSSIRYPQSTRRATAYVERLPHITVQRHAREHAIANTPAIGTQHHQPTHTL